MDLGYSEAVIGNIPFLDLQDDMNLLIYDYYCIDILYIYFCYFIDKYIIYRVSLKIVEIRITNVLRQFVCFDEFSGKIFISPKN